MKTTKIFAEIEPRLSTPKTGKPLKRKLPVKERNKIIKEIKTKKVQEHFLYLIRRQWRDFENIFGNIDDYEFKYLDIIKKEKIKIGDIIFLWTGNRILPTSVNYIRNEKVYSGEVIYEDDEEPTWKYIYVSHYPSNVALVFRKKKEK